MCVTCVCEVGLHGQKASVLFALVLIFSVVLLFLPSFSSSSLSSARSSTLLVRSDYVSVVKAHLLPPSARSSVPPWQKCRGSSTVVLKTALKFNMYKSRGQNVSSRSSAVPGDHTDQDPDLLLLYCDGVTGFLAAIEFKILFFLFDLCSILTPPSRALRSASLLPSNSASWEATARL